MTINTTAEDIAKFVAAAFLINEAERGIIIPDARLEIYRKKIQEGIEKHGLFNELVNAYNKP